MDGKTKAIVAHITIIGWVIALIVNSQNKDEIASFYIRQLLGIYILGIILSIIPVINLIGWIVTVALWIISLIGAASGEEREVPVVGEYFQQWFRGL